MLKTKEAHVIECAERDEAVSAGDACGSVLLTDGSHLRRSTEAEPCVDRLDWVDAWIAAQVAAMSPEARAQLERDRAVLRAADEAARARAQGSGRRPRRRSAA